jgi:hypothetical protein
MLDTVSERVPDPRYRGMNPEFVRRVWKKRRAYQSSTITVLRMPRKPTFIVDPVFLKLITPRRRLIADIAAVGITYGVSIRHIMSKKRTHRVVHARQAAFFMVKFTLGYSLADIGRLFDVDHTTVLHGIGRHMKRVGINHPWSERLEGRLKEMRAYTSARSH